MLLDYKTAKMRFQKAFLLCRVKNCAKIGTSGFMSQVVISYIEGFSLWFLWKYLLKESKWGEPSYFVNWLTLRHNDTQVMSWTSLNCFLECLPTQVGSFNPLFWRKNEFWCKHTLFSLLQGQLKTFAKLLQRKSGLWRGRKNNSLRDLLWILILKVK